MMGIAKTLHPSYTGQIRQALIQGADANAALVAAVQKIDTPT
jgi:hypothetical protein